MLAASNCGAGLVAMLLPGIKRVWAGGEYKCDYGVGKNNDENVSDIVSNLRAKCF